MKTKIINLYSFQELNEDQQQKAIENLYGINVNYEWWESIYDDAKNVGIRIEGFDIDRGSYCNGSLIEDALYTANKILSDHGDMCETYKTAKDFLAERDELVNNAEKDEDDEFLDEYELDQDLDKLENDFLKSILEDYRIMLQNEYEFLTSKKAIIETIEANEYTFNENGEIDS